MIRRNGSKFVIALVAVIMLTGCAADFGGQESGAGQTIEGQASTGGKADNKATDNSTTDKNAADKSSTDNSPEGNNTADKNADATGGRTEAGLFPETDGKLGDFGRLMFADGSYSAALYYEVEDDPAQAIVDAEDSAVATRRKEYPDSTLVIADHTDQGFAVLYDAKPGETAAYIFKTEDEAEEYVCEDKFQGHNNLQYLTDEDGNDLSFAPTDLVMYTCNESWENVTITYWKRTGTVRKKPD